MIPLVEFLVSQCCIVSSSSSDFTIKNTRNYISLNFKAMVRGFDVKMTDMIGWNLKQPFIGTRILFSGVAEIHSLVPILTKE